MVLFLVAGFGFGNAARQLAIIQELRKKDRQLPITVFSWGRGYEFLLPEAEKSEFQLRSLFSFLPRLKDSFLLSFAITGLLYLVQYPLNFLYLLGWSLFYRPKLVVFDSDYHVPALLFTRAFRVSVNQVPNIYWRSKRYRFSFIRTQGFLFSYLVENLDYWFQYLFANEILVPMLEPQMNPRPPAWVRPIPLIVREEFRNQPQPVTERSKRPALILGGSGVDTKKVRAWSEKYFARVFERRHGENSEVSMLVKNLNTHNPVFLQGGLSSISECLALKKYLWISPVEKHWEQFINTEDVVSLGLGSRINLNESWIGADTEFRKYSPRLDVDCSGASVVCDYLCEKIKKARKSALAEFRACP